MFPMRLKEPDPSERRRGGRLRCSHTKCQFGQITDMSRTGLRCLTRRPVTLPEGKVTHLKITCADRTIVVPARPVHSRPGKDGMFRTGFLFVGLSEQHADQLMALARAAATSDGCIGRMSG